MPFANSTTGVKNVPAELQQIESTAAYMTDESLRVTRDILRLCRVTQHAGAVTLADLHSQGEQLQNVEGDLDTIHSNMKNAEDNLIKMERAEKRCCCCCASCFIGRCCLSLGRTKSKNEQVWDESTSEDSFKPITQQPTSENPDGNGDFVERITNDPKEGQMDNNLREVSTVVGNLKNLAIDMGSEVRTQNNLLDRLNTKAESNEIHVASAEKRARNLL